MTAQIGDKFRYKNGTYNIVAISVPIQFKPESYGIYPEPRCTACWNGYWCDYEISEEGIFLQNLYINAKDNNYPEINGVKVNNNETHNYQYIGHHLYENIHLPIAYSGKIVVGKDFLRDYYIHMGYQRAWAYEVLLEFVFEEGVLLEVIDHSNIAKSIRKRLKNTKIQTKYPQSKDDILTFIDDSFSLEFDKKAWWI